MSAGLDTASYFPKLQIVKKNFLTFTVEPFTSLDLSCRTLCYPTYQAGTHSC